MHRICIVLCLLISFFLIDCNAQTEILSKIQNLVPEEVKVEGFRLDREQEIAIKGVAFRMSKRHGSSFSDAWILNSQTREVVWLLEDAEISKKERELTEFQDRISLEKGNYEVYFSTYPRYDDWGWHSASMVKQFYHAIFDGDWRQKDFEEAADKFKMVIRGHGRRFSETNLDELHDNFQRNAFVLMRSLRDNEYLQQGFLLERPAEVEIYAIGEARKDDMYDYGWIINTETREKVWNLTYRHSDHAGGARKNRLVNETISLPAGKYIAYFATDDSHSYPNWNSAPPYDPAFWGLTLKVDPDMKKYVRNYDLEDGEGDHAIIKFTGLGEDELRFKRFTCNRDLNLRIYALGEGRRREMFDYGWIVDSKSHERVWEMDYFNTEHGGGGKKNRLFNDVVSFQKGSYVVYFVTDGSHSYNDWNTGPPFDRGNWGISIYPADDDFKSTDISEGGDENVIVQLVEIGDHERERKKFTLDSDGEVRIYALGEGSGHMHDYGWIEDADSREVVWEMDYRQTEHAGGARKNRLVEDTIFLKKGEYILYYETDDSHSFSDWNANPPYDPIHWGITLYAIEN